MTSRNVISNMCNCITCTSLILFRCFEIKTIICLTKGLKTVLQQDSPCKRWKKLLKAAIHVIPKLPRLALCHAASVCRKGGLVAQPGPVDNVSLWGRENKQRTLGMHGFNGSVLAARDAFLGRDVAPQSVKGCGITVFMTSWLKSWKYWKIPLCNTRCGSSYVQPNPTRHSSSLLIWKPHCDCRPLVAKCSNSFAQIGIFGGEQWAVISYR